MLIDTNGKWSPQWRGRYASAVIIVLVVVAVLCAMMHPAAGLAEPPRWNLRYTGAVPQLNLEWK